MTELEPESSNILLKNTITYLQEIQNEIPPHLTVLKSYYALKYRILQCSSKIQVKEFAVRCPRCCLMLKETNPLYVVKPECKKPRFMRKVLHKIEKKKRLTKFQMKYVKKTKPTKDNQLVVTCNFCKKEIVHNMKKPVKRTIDVNANKRPAKNNKKKKKKDPYCGLVRTAVTTQTKKSAKENKSENRVQDNPILQRKRRKVEKKNFRKLKETLSQNTTSKRQNNLNSFLKSLTN